MKPIILPKILQPFHCKDLIRLGKDNDGGYLINAEDVKKTEHLISLGVGSDYSFEEAFAAKNNCPINAYDGRPLLESDKAFFTGNRTFTNRFITGQDKFFSSLVGSNFFLKCDIENDEYELLDELIINSHKFSGMVIEFHEVEVYERFNELTSFIAKTDLKLAHIHINNWKFFTMGDRYMPSVLELTFTSSKNISHEPVVLPHELDMPNCAERDEFKIEF